MEPLLRHGPRSKMTGARFTLKNLKNICRIQICLLRLLPLQTRGRRRNQVLSHPVCIRMSTLRNTSRVRPPPPNSYESPWPNSEKVLGHPYCSRILGVSDMTAAGLPPPPPPPLLTRVSNLDPREEESGHAYVQGSGAFLCPTGSRVLLQKRAI